MTRNIESALLRPPVLERIPSWALLLTGGLITLLTGPRWGIAALAWLAPVPYLLFARRASGARGSRCSASCSSYAFQCALFATPPVPVIAVIGLTAARVAALRAIGIGELVRRRLGEGVGLLAYVAATIGLDWIGYGVTELGAWMATANSQVESLTFLQSTAIAGLAGLGGMMAWIAGVATMLIAVRDRSSAHHGIVVALAMVAILVWGTSDRRPAAGSQRRRAAVVTTVGPDEHGMPDRATLAANTDALFERTRIAATRGARIVVWNEVATLVEPADELAFISRAIDRTGACDRFGARLRGVRGRATRQQVICSSTSAARSDRYQKHHPVPRTVDSRDRRAARARPSVRQGRRCDLLRLRLPGDGARARARRRRADPAAVVGLARHRSGPHVHVSRACDRGWLLARALGAVGSECRVRRPRPRASLDARDR
jgi:apolipoprotein N-acyltransferase